MPRSLQGTLKNRKGGEGRFTLVKDLMAAAANGTMADIEILSNDDGVHVASRFVLGARSPVLRRALYAKDDTGRESGGSHEFRLNYSSGVVRALLGYCCTNKIESFPADEARCRELVQLGESASVFELTELSEMVCETAGSLLRSFPSLAGAIFDEACGNEAVTSLKNVALRVIEREPENTLLKRHGLQREMGVYFLKAASLEEILKNRSIRAEEISLFRVLIAWSDAKPSAVSERENDWLTPPRSLDRKKIALQFAERYINLACIAPSDLVGCVTESGLVSPDKISAALLQVALRLENEGAGCASKTRGTSAHIDPPQVSFPDKRQEATNPVSYEFDDVSSVIADAHIPYSIERSTPDQRDASPRVDISPRGVMERSSPRSDYSHGIVPPKSDSGRSSRVARWKLQAQTRSPGSPISPPRLQRKNRNQLKDVVGFFAGDGCCKYANDRDSNNSNI